MAKGTFNLSGVQLKAEKQNHLGLLPEQIQVKPKEVPPVARQMSETPEKLTGHTHTSKNNNNDIYQPDPNDCSIEVTGVRQTTSKQTVKMYFQSAKSGGGKIVSIVHNKNSGHYIITFQDRESKYLITVSL